MWSCVAHDCTAQRLGEGSYGSVWKGIHNKTQVTCAVKVVDMEDEDVNELVKEVEIMRTLDGPNIVQVPPVRPCDWRIRVLPHNVTAHSTLAHT